MFKVTQKAQKSQKVLPAANVSFQKTISHQIFSEAHFIPLKVVHLFPILST